MTAKIIVSIKEGNSLQVETEVDLEAKGASGFEVEIAKRMATVYAENIALAIQCAIQSITNEVAEKRGIPAPRVENNAVDVTREQMNDVVKCPKCNNLAPRGVYQKLGKCYACGLDFDESENDLVSD